MFALFGWRNTVPTKASYNDSEKSADDEGEKEVVKEDKEPKEDNKKEDVIEKEEVKEEKKEVKEEAKKDTEEKEESTDSFIDEPKFKKYINEKIADKTLSEEIGNKILKDTESFKYTRKEKSSATDSADDVFKSVSKRISKRNELAKEVSKYIGEFACDEMTPEEVAKYACEKLGMTFDSADQAMAKIDGFISAKNTMSSKTFSLDEKDTKKSIDRLQLYLNQKR